MTLLEAVNESLANIRQLPVTSIVGTTETEVQLAVSNVLAISRDVQSSRPWWFNTRYNVTYALSGDRVYSPFPILSADWVITGDELISTVPATGTQVEIIDLNLGGATGGWAAPVSARVVRYEMPFESLPFEAARYISLRAARIFADRVLGNGQNSRSATVEELSAYTVLQRSQLANYRPNMLLAPGVIDIVKAHGTDPESIRYVD